MKIELDPNAKLTAAIAEYLNSGGTFERGLLLLKATAYLHGEDITTGQAASKTGKKENPNEARN